MYVHTWEMSCEPRVAQNDGLLPTFLVHGANALFFWSGAYVAGFRIASDVICQHTLCPMNCLFYYGWKENEDKMKRFLDKLNQDAICSIAAGLSGDQTITLTNNSSIPRTFVVYADLGLCTFSGAMPEFLFEWVCHVCEREPVFSLRRALAEHELDHAVYCAILIFDQSAPEGGDGGRPVIGCAGEDRSA
jgi:hypothetical protein